LSNSFLFDVQTEKMAEGKYSQIKLFAQLISDTSQVKLALVHPRRANRTDTMWSQAICVAPGMKTKLAFRVLIQDNITAAIVTQENGSIVGLFDLPTLVRRILQTFDLPRGTSLQTFMEQCESFGKSTVGNTLQNKQSLSIDCDQSLLEGIQLIASGSVQRIAIFNKEIESVCGILTQSMIVGWLFINLEKNPQMKSIHVQDVIPCDRKELPIVKIESTAMDAFRLMTSLHVQSVGIVDDSGALVDILFMKDIYVITYDCELYTRLSLPVRKFKEKVRQAGYSKKMTVIKPTDTLHDLVNSLEQNAVTQIFVCADDHNKPQSIVTAADVIRFVFL
jgi:CBS domain-containing protein